jgi:hypothetical protein
VDDDLKTVKRLNYFDNQFLTAKDFNEEQNYHLARRRLHNRMLHTWGIASGLEVEAKANATAVTVAPGVAIDDRGHEIVVTEEEIVKFGEAFKPLTPLSVTIAYKQVQTDHAGEKDVGGNTRWTEQPEFTVHDGPLPPDSIVLAVVTLDAQRQIKAIDTKSRRPAGAAGGHMNLLEVSLGDGAIDEKSWVQMRLEKPGAALLTGNLHTSGGVDADGAGAFAGGLIVSKDLTVGGSLSLHEPGKSFPTGGVGVYAPFGKFARLAADAITGPGFALMNDGTVTGSAALTMSGSAVFRGGLTVTGSNAVFSAALTVVGPAGTLIVSGPAKFTGPVNVIGPGGSLTVSGAAIITEGGSLTVGAPSTFNGAVNVNAPGGLLTVGAPSTFNGAVNVNAPGGSLTVSGPAKFTGPVNVIGPGGSLTVSGAAIITEGGSLTVGAPSTFNGAVNVNAPGGSLTVRASSTFTGPVNVNAPGGSLTVTGPASLTSGLSVTGNVGIGLGIKPPLRLLHVEGEIYSGGGGAGLSFGGRDSPVFNENPGSTGQRWTWLAGGGRAQLWSGSTLLSVSPEGVLNTTGGINCGGLLDMVTPMARIHGKSRLSIQAEEDLLLQAKGDVWIGYGAPQISGGSVVNLHVSGALFALAGKSGYVIDQFVNDLDDALEQGDVVVFHGHGTNAYYGSERQIPVPEVDLTEEAYDTRLCGIVEAVYGEMAQVVSEDTADGDATVLEPRLFEGDEGAALDRTTVRPGQLGGFVTLGAYGYCKVDADIAPIVPGDLLTTSPTKGHAQKVLDRSKATGATLGKALGSLQSGKGKIPVFVNVH